MQNDSLSPCEQYIINGSRNRLQGLVTEPNLLVFSPSDDPSIWTIVTLVCSSIGIALTAAALTLLVLTASLFPEWRKSYKNQLLIQLMFARLFYSAFRFFIDLQKMFQTCPLTQKFLSGDLFGMFYTEMVLVLWMFIFSRQMYISLVKVFAENSSIWGVSLFAWLGPVAVTSILYALFTSGDKFYKYFVLYLMVFKWPVLIANAVILILVLKSVITNSIKTENCRRIIVVMIILIFTFGFYQIVVDVCKIYYIRVTYNGGIMQTLLMISNILSMYHCAFSITFWVLGNASTRKLWLFRGKGLRDKIRLSTRFSSAESQP
ncbi:unnamed protein product [Chrysodeixis includens]|uniref:Uncharacterized protein n=1 Tax=Chrysodeixis includens TaxID=689277 RepID=A0A9P0C4N8_CHRIL|nr:unnamed protein product [Chrysodeixis includens]